MRHIMQVLRLLAAFLVLGQAAHAQSADWTGLYGGAALDFTRIELANSGTGAVTNDGSGLMIGAEGGYRYDLGQVVVGATASLMVGSVQAPPVVGVAAQDPALNALMTVGIEAGYDFGQVLVYGGVGHTWSTMRTIAGSRRFESGYQFGIGADYMLSDTVLIGGGVSQTILDNFSGSDVEAMSFGLRAAYRF
jgi:hypothetical protein